MHLPLRSLVSAGESLARQPVAGPLVRAGLFVPIQVGSQVRKRFRTRLSGDASGVPDWVRDIATVGEGPGLFEPGGVVWRVHGDLSTLVGGVAALLGQATHPRALRGVEEHSAYREDPWARLAGTARWLVTLTFGSEHLAERESARVRGMHRKVSGRGYAASDPDLLRWVHLAFTDAFLHAQLAVGEDLSRRFGRTWPDTYVREWAVTAERLGATDLPTTAQELYDAIAALEPDLAPVPRDMRRFLQSPPGLSPAERLFYATLSRAGGQLLHPTLAPFAGVPGRGSGLRRSLELQAVRLELQSLHLAVGSTSPSEQAARWRLRTAPQPPWLETAGRR